MNDPVKQTDFPNLKFFNRGKVRDIYEVGEDLLIIATDRISAFDIVMPDPIPGKGIILNSMSVFWFKQMDDIINNHIITTDVAEYPPECSAYARNLKGRSMLARKATPLPVECVVRGYLSGSGWKDYSQSGTISGIKLPEGLRESSKLPEAIFTPTTKAPQGQHDTAITTKDVEDIIGAQLTKKIIKISMDIYERAVRIAADAGIIIADTKMEFGLIGDELILIDELLTPDSSRFWPADEYEEGRSINSFDKQFLRDYLISINWNQHPPAPNLSPEIIEKTRARYEEAFLRLVLLPHK
ncbi:MAG TPA: phosphoribosylaminoimidazolesuccinocarboxamide synthase [Deltaproteobacteria bacterium]|nr:phosphoribosylaminoimidazolesuccinocarboxamide synthase [Deltaproteobacteria bacterium]